MLSQLGRWYLSYFLSGASDLVAGLLWPRISFLCCPCSMPAKPFGCQCGKLAEKQFASSCQPSSWHGCTAEGAAQGQKGLVAGRRRACAAEAAFNRASRCFIWKICKVYTLRSSGAPCQTTHCPQNTPNSSCTDPNKGWVNCTMEHFKPPIPWFQTTLLNTAQQLSFLHVWLFYLWRCELFTYQTHLHANIFILNILLNADICMLRCFFIIRYLFLQILLLFVPQTWENIPLQYPFEEWCSWVCFWASFFVWKCRCLLFSFWSSSVCVYKCLSGFLMRF